MLRKHLSVLFTLATSALMETPVESTSNSTGKVWQKTVLLSEKGNVPVEEKPGESNQQRRRDVSLFLCGDVMTGRGIDQILPNPSRPHLYESYVKDANDYVQLAEIETGPLPKKPVGYSYPWGDALSVLDEVRPDARIINLETSVTRSEENWPMKGIHYRMNPDNVPCITSARIDCCVLSNNHVLDWGRSGLDETLTVLKGAGLRVTGAGSNESEASAPAVIQLSSDVRVLVYGVADESSGVPSSWAATTRRNGVNFLHHGISRESAEHIAKRVDQDRRPSGDIVIVSIHWGGNWGYQITRAQQEFAHHLIDIGGADIIHGHSSHHVKGLEVYKDKLILYGCGDFLNDYEGIGVGVPGSTHEEFHDEFTLMYFPVLNAENGKLIRLSAKPMQIRHMRLNRAPANGTEWLYQTMKRECAKLGFHVEKDEERKMLEFTW